MSDAVSRLWLVYGDENPDDWKRYHGECECPSCRRYRLWFEKWMAERTQSLEAERAKLRSERDRYRAALVEITTSSRRPCRAAPLGTTGMKLVVYGTEARDLAAKTLAEANVR